MVLFNLNELLDLFLTQSYCVTQSDDKELSLGADAIGLNYIKKKKKKNYIVLLN